jgi:hypothetical protein
MSRTLLTHAFRFALLSLQHFLDLAVEELMAIGKDMLAPLEGGDAWTSHTESLDKIKSSYNSMLKAIRAKLTSASNAPPFTNVIGSHKELFEKLVQYKAQDHYGITTILWMRWLQSVPNPPAFDIVHSMIDRDRFIASLTAVIERQGLQKKIWMDFTKTQLLIPPSLLKIPTFAKMVQKDGRKDCLWRPIGHIFHDSKVGEEFDYHAHNDGYDILGRSRLHLACKERDDQILDLKTVPCWKWEGREALGLNALHVAAIYGNVAIFRMACEDDHGMRSLADSAPSKHTKREYLHWAANFGHVELVEYLLSLCTAAEGNMFQSLLRSTDWQGNTALRLATRNGHKEIADAISLVTDSGDQPDIPIEAQIFLMDAFAGNHSPTLDEISLCASHTNLSEETIRTWLDSNYVTNIGSQHASDRDRGSSRSNDKQYGWEF